MLELLGRCEEEGKSCLSRRLEESSVVFQLLETKAGRQVFLRAALSTQEKTLRRVWNILEPVSSALAASEKTCYILERIIQERAEAGDVDLVSCLIQNKDPFKWMMTTRHCIGLIEVIAEKCQDDQLMKITNWILSDLSLVISSEVAGQAFSVVLQKLFSKFSPSPSPSSHLTSVRRRQDCSSEELRSEVLSLIDQLVEVDGSEELPPLVRASSEAGGHLFVLMLCRSLDQDPQLRDQLERVKNILSLHRQQIKNNEVENLFSCIIFAALKYMPLEKCCPPALMLEYCSRYRL